MVTVFILLVMAYLIGSLCSGILVCKVMGLPDPRTTGSNNPGTTNVLRVGGKHAAIITLIGDALKGFIPVALANMTRMSAFKVSLIAIAALLGHIFPIFFKFKGGKGVATLLGALLGLHPLLGILAIATWLITAFITRYSSLAALIMAASLPIYTLILGKPLYFLPLLIITGILIWRHWDNIQRLRSGAEGKISLFQK